MTCIHFARSLLIIISITANSVFGDELSDRSAIKSSVSANLSSLNFDALDVTATEYRKNKSRLESGVWKLSTFYLGVSDWASWNTKDSKIWEAIKAVTSQWYANYPSSPTAVIIHGIILENFAWSIREPDTLDKVENASLIPFRKNLVIAKEFLEKNKSIGSKDPHWYVSMIRIATALQVKENEILNLVTEANKKEPLYYQTYFAAVDYFSPKWGGNAQTLEKFVRFVVDKTKIEEGMALYARIYWASLQSWYSSEIWPAVNWKDFSKGIDDVLAKYPDQWNINNFAKLSCTAKDKPLTKKLLSKIKGEPNETAWGDRKEYDTCRLWSQAP